MGENVIMEFSAPNIPQQNGIAEMPFTTLYKRVQLIVNYTYFKGIYGKKIRTGCVKTTIELDGILIKKRGEKNNFEKIPGTNPSYHHHLQISEKLAL